MSTATFSPSSECGTANASVIVTIVVVVVVASVVAEEGGMEEEEEVVVTYPSSVPITRVESEGRRRWWSSIWKSGAGGVWSVSISWRLRWDEWVVSCGSAQPKQRSSPVLRKHEKN